MGRLSTTECTYLSTCSVRFLAAVTDCDRTKEAMVDNMHSFSFPFRTVFSSPDILQQPSDQGPAAQFQVPGDFSKVITDFPRIVCP